MNQSSRPNRCGVDLDYTLPQDEILPMFLAANHHKRIVPPEMAGTLRSGYTELRYKLRGESGMRAEFHRVGDCAGIGQRIRDLATTADTYFGVLRRTEQSGKASACCSTRMVWCDLDNGLEGLADFEHLPEFLVETSPRRFQAHWIVRDWLAAKHVRRANLRLAHRLGGDKNACDAARILRPPGSINWKYDEPHRVRCVSVATGITSITVSDLVGNLPDPPETKITPIRPASRQNTDDPLLGIPAAEYVAALTGRIVGRDHKAVCPFHGGGNERTPSLHAYDDPSQGHFCFGCDAGGDIYNFAARLYDLDPKRDFPQIKQRLIAGLRRAAA